MQMIGFVGVFNRSLFNNSMDGSSVNHCINQFGDRDSNSCKLASQPKSAGAFE
eukprot:m.34433 g.34433  ORF g.34433 m.34433 type:complete len:53 (+) comp31980_c0_seq6:709-867(+)